MGNIELTTPALAILLQSDIDVVFMTIYGRVRGRLLASESKYAELRVRQLRLMSDEQSELPLARQIIGGKLANQRALLMSYDRSAPAGVAQAAQGVAGMAAAAQRVANLDSLRGCEGRAAAYYWPAFKLLLKNSLGFSQRIYNPPADPVNALLSFGYALLQKDVATAVRLVGLDPYLGSFHVIQYGRPSLVLDLMEEFRPLIVDRMTLALLNLGVIGQHDFARDVEHGRPFSLSPGALKRVIEAYEQRVTAMVRYPLTGEQTMLRRCFELQVRQVARLVRGEQAAYRPFVADGTGRPS